MKAREYPAVIAWAWATPPRTCVLVTETATLTNIASPKEPPICCPAFNKAEASPVCCGETADTAVKLIGKNNIPNPIPRTIEGPKILAIYPLDGVSWANQTRAAADIRAPTAMGKRGPVLLISRDMAKDITVMLIDKGR